MESLLTHTINCHISTAVKEELHCKSQTEDMYSSAALTFVLLLMVLALYVSASHRYVQMCMFHTCHVSISTIILTFRLHVYELTLEGLVVAGQQPSKITVSNICKHVTNGSF